MENKKESDKLQDKPQERHGVKETFNGKKRPPRKLGHSLSDKRPHFKSFKSPGVK